MINKPTLHETRRAEMFLGALGVIAQPTPAMRWLERAGKQLRETREAE